MNNFNIENEESKFYNYIYLDPFKPGQYCYEGLNFSLLYEPFYVGYGKNNRLFSHLNEVINNEDKILTKGNKLKFNKIRKIIKENSQPYIIQIYKDQLLEESRSLEVKIIQSIGRRDLKMGPLTNMTDGGEGASNHIKSEETKAKISAALRGKKITPENIEKRMINLLPVMQSDEYRNKMKISCTGKIRSDETKNKISQLKLELYKDKTNHPHFGKLHSEETIKKQKDSMTNFYKDPINRKKQSENLRKVRAKNYVVIDNNDQETYYTNFGDIQQWCSENGYAWQTLSKSLSEKRKIKSGKLANWQLIIRDL